jgi:hypothetical protein
MDGDPMQDSVGTAGAVRLRVEQSTSRAGWQDWRISVLVCALFTAAIASWFWRAWHPGPRFYAFNLPLAPPFAAFVLERLVGHRSRALMVDVAVVTLALARVFVPPFPFMSGHVLFTSYAMLTAARWPLRASAALALLCSLYVKLIVWGDWKTPLPALLVAGAAAFLRRRLATRGQR